MGRATHRGAYRVVSDGHSDIRNIHISHSSANNQMVALMQEQVANLARPYIEISTFLTPGSVIVYLRIKNTGDTSAHNLRLSMDKDFYKYGRSGAENNLAQLYAFTHTIETFPPRAELIFALAQSFILFGENANEEITPRIFSIHAVYSYRERTVSEKTIIDLNQYYQTYPEPNRMMEKFDKSIRALESLDRSVQQISLSMPERMSLNTLGPDEDEYEGKL
jgi:hypothetical protein